jgi:tRNA threonylcarbamoyladenosine biosynthesis protein TsaE
MEKIYQCKNLADTQKAAEEIATLLKGREVLAFFGDLGAGKTTFIRALCQALGLKDEVTSPTFAMVHEYRSGSFPVYHFDMYRVSGWDDLYSTGFFDYLDTGVLAIEWSENIDSALPEDTIRVVIARGDGDSHRRIEISGIDLPTGGTV